MKNNARGTRRKKLTSERLEERQMLAADTLESIDLDQILEDTVVDDVPAIDGSNNNLENPDWGAAEIELLRLTAVEYADGLSEVVDDLPSAREVSNAVADQAELEANDRNLTDFVWLWGQFIDHDITLSVEADPEEHLEIEVPLGDEDFDPFGTGTVTIDTGRSDYVVDEDGVRQQVNTITAYIDGSVVYGSDDETAASLREFAGGRMLTSEGDLLPVGDDGFFLAGDVRANENAALTSMHTLWVREHNRLAEEIVAADPTLDPVADDEEIYQQARALVTAQIQAITYNEWLPALLGVDAITSYEGYDPEVNASIANVFSTAAYRFGHSMLSTELLRLNPDGTVVDEGNLSLADAFFSPDIVLEGGIDSLLQGAAAQVAQEIDTMIVDDVRNFLFGPPGAGGLDLASLNIERGRDHGLADYNQTREDFGLERVTSFDEITSDEELATKLEALYGSVDNIDVWVGVLAEDHVAGSSLGELGRTILVDQFSRLRDGDRFWYENVYEGETLETLQNTSLSDVIERNTDVANLQQNVFYDASVLYYSVDAGDGPANVVVITRGEDLVAVDVRSGEVVATVPADEASGIVLVGSEENGDRFTIGASVADLDLAGGVVIDAGDGGRDRLMVRGDAEEQTYTLDGAFLEIGDMTVQIEGVEGLDLRTGRGPDEVDIVDNGDMRVVVDGDLGQSRGDGGDRDRDDNRGRRRTRVAHQHAGPAQRNRLAELAGPSVRGELAGCMQGESDVDKAFAELTGRDRAQANRLVIPPFGREISTTLADNGGGRRR